MKNLLIIAKEKSFIHELQQGFKIYSDNFKIISATNSERAVDILNSADIDLIVTDYNVPEFNGVKFLEYLNKKYVNIPFIVLTSGISEVNTINDNIQPYKYIRKPVSITSLINEIFDAISTDKKNVIEGFSLDSYLQMVEKELKTWTLQVRSQGKTGYLYFIDGKLIDAQIGKIDGIDAAVKIVKWNKAKVYVMGTCKKEKNINVPIMHILMRAAKEKDEQGDSDSIDEQLYEAIKLVQGHHFDTAREILKNLLNEKPRNHKGWLWFSRTVNDMNVIKSSLRNASIIAPTDPEIVLEIDKCNMAKECGIKNKICHCPFCWSPVKSDAIFCQYCRAYLLICEHFFSFSQTVDENIIKHALKRYINVIKEEKNIKACYYMSIAYLNLKTWEKALNYLNKAVTLDPENKYMAKQLQMLLDHLASMEYAAEKKISEDVFHKKKNTKDNTKKVLVVANNTTTRKVISIALSQHGYKIIEAKDGLEALNTLSQERPNIILMDIILPKMDGYGVLSVINNNAQLKDIPVIILTSRNSLLDRLKAKMFKSRAYLIKPFKTEKLIETVEKYI